MLDVKSEVTKKSQNGTCGGAHKGINIITSDNRPCQDFNCNKPTIVRICNKPTFLLRFRYHTYIDTRNRANNMNKIEFIHAVARHGMFRALWLAQYMGVSRKTMQLWVSDLIVKD